MSEKQKFLNWAQLAEKELQEAKAKLAAGTAERDALREALELMVACANSAGWGNAELENAEAVLASIAAKGGSHE